MTKNLLLFSCCKIVDGVNRSLIIDIQREQLFGIPLEVSQYIKEHDHYLNYEELIIDNEPTTINELWQYLLENELAFYCEPDEGSYYPPISDDFNIPGIITNCIIDINPQNIDMINADILKQLSDLGCHHLQVRFFEVIEIEKFKILLNTIHASSIRHLEIIINWTPYFTIDNCLQLIRSNPRLKYLFVSSSPEEHSVYSVSSNNGSLVMTTTPFISSLQCGVISSAYFNFKLDHFTESLHHNTCLNRKISIDQDGNIKNCPSMPMSFGHITKNTLREVVDNPQFQSSWNLKKDMIDKCKDCEYRHVCTDCRAYTVTPENLLAAPLKCGYNPYTGIWDDWKQEEAKFPIIVHYKMTSLLKIIG